MTRSKSATAVRSERRDEDRPGQGVEGQVERHRGGARRRFDAERRHVDRVHHEEVPVHLVAGRRGRPVVAHGAEVVARRGTRRPAGCPRRDCPRPRASSVTPAGMSTTVQCQKPDGVGASGSKQLTTNDSGVLGESGPGQARGTGSPRRARRGRRRSRDRRPRRSRMSGLRQRERADLPAAARRGRGRRGGPGSRRILPRPVRASAAALLRRYLRPWAGRRSDLVRPDLRGSDDTSGAARREPAHSVGVRVPEDGADPDTSSHEPSAFPPAAVAGSSVLITAGGARRARGGRSGRRGRGLGCLGRQRAGQRRRAEARAGRRTTPIARMPRRWPSELVPAGPAASRRSKRAARHRRLVVRSPTARRARSRRAPRPPARRARRRAAIGARGASSDGAARRRRAGRTRDRGAAHRRGRRARPLGSVPRAARRPGVTRRTGASAAAELRWRGTHLPRPSASRPVCAAARSAARSWPAWWGGPSAAGGVAPLAARPAARPGGPRRCAGSAASSPVCSPCPLYFPVLPVAEIARRGCRSSHP